MADFPYLGHTEYITDFAGGDMSLMLLTSDQLTVGLVTAHIPLEEVAEEITADIILDKLAEETEITPAILAAKENGIMAAGPFPADGFFGNGSYKKFDAILAMYHDQGLIPFKTLSFGTGVNFTAGLDLIRTSPDHGTAYEIAGKNMADPSSMRHAIYKAIDIVSNRKVHDEVSSNSLDVVVEHKEEAD